MKNKIKCFLCMLSVFSLTACVKDGYENKNIEDMSLIELNKYNDYLSDLEDTLSDNIYNLKDISQGKSEEEIIALINYVNTEIVKSNVMITNESKSFFHTSSISSGSGTIIKEDDTYYYVLTNNHVIYSLGNRSTYYIYDYLNNEYNASVMFNDPNYDMALLKFTKGQEELKVTEIASENIVIDENVIAIGQPLGQRNAITFGEVLKYEVVNCPGCNPLESNIQYECVYYDAPTNNGNSGGMLINYDYKLVGVVTYGLNSSNGDYLYGAGSPATKVREFLANNNFEVGDTNA